jgi:hypothetical protein
MLPLLASLLMLAAGTPGGGPPAHVVVVDGTTFGSAYRVEKGGQYLTEYVPIGETIDRWSRLVGVRRFPQIDNPVAYVLNLASGYHKRQPTMRFASEFDPKRHRAKVDFLEPAATYVEWDYFRAEQSKGGGIIVYQYAVKIPRVGDPDAMGSVFHALRGRLIPILDGSLFADTPAK